MSTEKTDIVARLREIHGRLANPGALTYPVWFLEHERERRHGGWLTLFEGAIAEIERGGTSGELEQMRQLAGRLMRRLSDGSDLPMVEAHVRLMEDL